MTKATMRGLTLALAVLLCGCVDTVVMRDPATGQTAQCTGDAGFPIFAHHQVNSCVAAYQRMGWQRQ